MIQYVDAYEASPKVQELISSFFNGKHLCKALECFPPKKKVMARDSDVRFQEWI